MKSTIDLLNLEFVFSQQTPLTPNKFIKAFEQRVLAREFRLSDWEQLEELHRVGALIPMFRFKKNTRSLLNEARQRKQLATSVRLGRDVSFAMNLHGNEEIGSLVDPQTEAYKTWYSYMRSYKTDYLYPDPSTNQEKTRSYWASSFLYSPYQLLLIPKLRNLISQMRRRRRHQKYPSFWKFRLRLNEHQQNEVRKEAEESRELVIALTALEAKYLPQLRGHGFSSIYSGTDSFVEKLMTYQQTFDPTVILNWIGWDAHKVKNTAEKLLWQADRLDPLHDWHELVRMCHPDMLNKLHGDALIALDHRRAAEMLLRFYEDLQAHDAAPQSEDVPKYIRRPHHTRLRYDPNSLDEVLMKFGLSPQPSLELIIEGETEELIVPKVMDLIGIPLHSNFIHIFNIQGIGKKLELLVRRIIKPKLGQSLETNQETNAVELIKPPTHFFVLVDAEKDYETASSREEERAKWIKAIYKATPSEYRTPNYKNALDSFVSIETWNEQIFEFAHFTDEEICEAMIEVYRNQQGSLSNLMTQYNVTSETELASKLKLILSRIRPKGNIEKSITDGWDYTPRKPKIAEVLWPTLKNKIKIASEQDDIESVPIVRVLLKAWEIAAHLHRKDVIMPY